jgi:hypothetical protein
MHLPILLPQPASRTRTAGTAKINPRTAKNRQEHQKAQTHSKPSWQRKGAVRGGDGRRRLCEKEMDTGRERGRRRRLYGEEWGGRGGQRAGGTRHGGAHRPRTTLGRNRLVPQPSRSKGSDPWRSMVVSANSDMIPLNQIYLSM